jgi:hypothetical protein
MLEQTVAQSPLTTQVLGGYVVKRRVVGTVSRPFGAAANRAPASGAYPALRRMQNFALFLLSAFAVAHWNFTTALLRFCADGCTWRYIAIPCGNSF